MNQVKNWLAAVLACAWIAVALNIALMGLTLASRVQDAGDSVFNDVETPLGAMPALASGFLALALVMGPGSLALKQAVDMLAVAYSWEPVKASQLKWKGAV